jgi:hypothetical protein
MNNVKIYLNYYRKKVTIGYTDKRQEWVTRGKVWKSRNMWKNIKKIEVIRDELKKKTIIATGKPSSHDSKSWYKENKKVM